MKKTIAILSFLIFVIHFVSIVQIAPQKNVNLYDNFFNPKSFVSYPKYLIGERTFSFKKVAIKPFISQINYVKTPYLFSAESQRYVSTFGLGNKIRTNTLGFSINTPHEALVIGAIGTLIWLTTKEKKKKRVIFKAIPLQ